MIAIASPLLGTEEIEAVTRVLVSGQLSQGEQVAEFEQRFAALCQVREAVAVSSGTAALHLALLAHEIGPGDEVITTPLSFVATVNAILLVGATPVFVDIEPETYTMDPAGVEAAITSHTRALLPVHLYGHPCAMDALQTLAESYHLVMIEDACQAHAASFQGQAVGSFGTGCFSFYATKNMTTGEGGMVTTNDSDVAERVRLLRNHGQSERYRHIRTGYNLRLTELQAALGLAQLAKLEPFTRQRIANAAFLSEHLAGVVQTPQVRPGCRHVFHQYTIRVPAERDAWMTALHAHGIATAVHYPIPLHKQLSYQQVRTQMHHAGPGERDLHIAEEAAQQVLSLPVHPALRTRDLETIVEEVLMLCS